jgi:hypothetical protein
MDSRLFAFSVAAVALLAAGPATADEFTQQDLALW